MSLEIATPAHLVHRCHFVTPLNQFGLLEPGPCLTHFPEQYLSQVFLSHGGGHFSPMLTQAVEASSSV